MSTENLPKSTLNNNIEPSDPEVEKLLKKFSSKCNNLHEILDQLRNKVAEDELLKNRCLDDTFLLRFLNVRNFEVDATIVLMKGYFSMRKDYADYFKLPSELIALYENEIMAVLPDEKEDGKAFFVCQIAKWNPQEIPAQHLVAGAIPFFEVLAATHGELEVTEIVDCQNMEFRHFFAVPVSVNKIGADLTERALPFKYNKIHIVNEGKIVDMLWAIAKPFLSEEMKNKLVFHGTDYKGLLDSVDSSFVPVHLGGKLELSKHKVQPEQLVQLDEKIKTYWKKYSVE